ncbi:MAG: serine--tRNA ligase [Luteibaculum sp.]
MLEIHRIRESKEEVLVALKKRGLKEAEIWIDNALKADDARKLSQTKCNEIQAQINSLSKQIGDLFKTGKQQEAETAKTEVSVLKAELSNFKTQLDQAEAELQKNLLLLPNAPMAEVPAGISEDDNEVVYESPDFKKPSGSKKPHWELAAKYKLIDFELGVKVTGAGFPFYIGKGAKLQRALINYFLLEAEKSGYQEIIPPHVVNEDSGFGTGQLPDKDGQMYFIGEDKLYLIPTAEVPLTNIYRDTIIKDAAELPIKICGYTPCFRREAGSYGKDVRGLNRLHQFDKVEIVRIEKPENSMQALEDMKNHVAKLLEKLGLKYRILRLCGGDLGFTSAITYDFEVYSAAQERWLEVSSVSNFENFQANRLKLRFKDAEGNKQLLHTLNGSALALPRVLAALLENYQTENGIDIPSVLHPFLSFQKI